MEKENGRYDVMLNKLNALSEVLANHSRTEWGGLDGKRLVMLIDQEVHPHANDDLYTLDEVAQILTMSVLTIRQYVRMGKLKAIKKWRNWMVPSNEIARLIYEKNNGIELNKRDSMFVIMDASIEEEETFFTAIYKYKFLTIDDVLNICETEYNSIKVREYEKLFERSPIDSIWIEVVSNIPAFFRKTGDVPFQKEKKDGKININTDFQVSPLVIEKILSETERFLYSDDAEEDIKALFGNPNEIDTVYKMYKTLLNLSKKIERLQHEIDCKNEIINRVKKEEL